MLIKDVQGGVRKLDHPSSGRPLVTNDRHDPSSLCTILVEKLTRMISITHFKMFYLWSSTCMSNTSICLSARWANPVRLRKYDICIYIYSKSDKWVLYRSLNLCLFYSRTNLTKLILVESRYWNLEDKTLSPLYTFAPIYVTKFFHNTYTHAECIFPVLSTAKYLHASLRTHYRADSRLASS